MTEKDQPPEPGSEALSGEANPAHDPTLQIRSRRRTKKPSVYDENTLSVPETDPTARRRKEMRRARDRLALRRALQVALVLALGVGLVGYLVVQGFVDEKEFSPEALEKAIAERKKQKSERSLSTPYNEVPNLPALKLLESEGLTICTEGLPKVEASVKDARSPILAAVETCRFAYGVWEFSPNKRFRFLSTCKSFEGQILVGAYDVDGSTIRLSPLKTPYVTLVSNFEVERPSRMRTVAEYIKGYQLLVEQKVTVLVPGLKGDAFRDNYAKKNSLQIERVKKDKAATEDIGTPQGDRLLKLLKKEK